jgi:glucan biosynthesis protein C
MPSTPRRHDLDWLRIFATYLLFPYHVGKTFDVLPMYHIKNAELSPALDYFTAFIHQWHMPLFFVLAGWAAHASLARRGSADFLKERAHRVLVPFLAGVILLCPVIKYVELSSGLSLSATGAASLARPFDESFARFLPTFYTRLDRFTWAHLWFLVYLLTFTVLYLPLFRGLLRRRPVPRPPSVAGLYAPLLPLVLIQTTLRFRWPGVQNLYDDWANFSYYSVFFILGFLLARQPAWDDVIAREWRRAGTIGLAAALAMTLGWMARGGMTAPQVAPTAASIAAAVPLRALGAVAGYGVVIAILGLARRHWSFTSATQDYLAESSLPVYILHQLGVVVPGYFIIQLHASIAVKITLLLVTSVTCTMVVYELVRRTVMGRALCGMKRIQPPTTVSLRAAVGG